MLEYIYSENGKYYKEITDLIGNFISKEEISEQEYIKAKENLI